MSQQKEGEMGARITPDIAKNDIERFLLRMGTINPGSKIDGAAQMVIRSLEVLSRRVDSPEILKMMYVENDEAAKMLPDLAMRTVKELTEGRISSDDARQALESAIPAYIEAFRELGVSPQPSWAVYLKD